MPSARSLHLSASIHVERSAHSAQRRAEARAARVSLRPQNVHVQESAGSRRLTGSLSERPAAPIVKFLEDRDELVRRLLPCELGCDPRANRPRILIGAAHGLADGLGGGLLVRIPPLSPRE